MLLQLIELEVAPAVIREDSDWLQKQFGSFPSAIDLALSRFPDHAEWPEYDPNQKFGIAWFPGESFPNFTAVDERFIQEGFGPERRAFPFHLAIEVVPRCDELWQASQEDNGPRWIYTSSTKSYWRSDGGHLVVPGVRVPPNDRRVGSRWAVRSFPDHYGFLVSCE